MSEAAARIKINKLLEAAGWRFFAEGDGPANVCLVYDCPEAARGAGRAATWTS